MSSPAGRSPRRTAAVGDSPPAGGLRRWALRTGAGCLAGALLLAPGDRRSPGPAIVQFPAPGVLPAAAESIGPRERTMPTRGPTRIAEVRALWVVRTTLTSPAAVRTMVGDAWQGGFNTLLVQVRGRGDAYYLSSLEPRAAALADQPRDFDPLALVLEEAHARGMTVHAWVNAMVVTNLTELPADPGHIARAAPDLLAVPRELARDLAGRDPFQPSYLRRLFRWARAHPDRVEGLYASPVRREVHDRLEEVLTDLVERYPVDGVHLDYLRYPSGAFDYSRGAMEAFRVWASPRVGPRRTAELDAVGRRDALAWPDALPGLWDTFRRRRLTDLVVRLRRRLRTLRPALVVSAAVVPDAADARGRRFQDWPAWLAGGAVDVVAPMAYTSDDRRFRARVGDALAAAGDPRRVWAGIGTHRTGFEGTVAQIRVARDVGAGGVVLFSYDWIRSRGRTPRGRVFLEDLGRRSSFTLPPAPPPVALPPSSRRPGPGPPGNGG